MPEPANLPAAGGGNGRQGSAGEPAGARRELRQKALLVLVSTALSVAVCAIAWKILRGPQNGGQLLNRTAWEATYLERGLEVPATGPREGYWGAKVLPKVPDSHLGWREPAVHDPGLLDIDERGLQHDRIADGERTDGEYRVIVLGGSVAFGAYASAISKTYFHVLATAAAGNGIYLEITVAAAGAWKSIQELKALQLLLGGATPDLVIFLDGLNDLTNGATSHSLYGQQIDTADGSEWTLQYHAHDYEKRVVDYLRNMAIGWQMVAKSGARMLVVLQPALSERQAPTALERRLLAASLEPHASLAALRESYAAMRQGLFRLAREEEVSVLDASRIFAAEDATVFADLWHFSDIGHEILGRAMAQEVTAILNPSRISR